MIVDGYQTDILTNNGTTGISSSETINPPKMTYDPKMPGWVCPVCGRGLSPFTAVCPCKNDCKVNDEPTIEQPVRMKGRWIKQIDESINAWWYECSACGDYPLKDAFGHDSLSQFCPWCGTQMTEGEEEC